MSVLTLSTPALPDSDVLLLGLAANGMTDRDIAQATGLRSGTVTRRVSRLLGDLEVESRAAAVAKGYREGWLERVPCELVGEAPTARQMQVVRLLLAGRGEREICRTLGLKPQGMRTLVYRAFRTVGARNRPHLIRICVDAGLVEIPGRPAC